MVDLPRERSQVMSLRKDRESILRVPVPPNVTHIDVDLRTEYVNGQPVVRYYLPHGGKIRHRKKA
jgi:hypothetical protein